METSCFEKADWVILVASVSYASLHVLALVTINYKEHDDSHIV